MSKHEWYIFPRIGKRGLLITLDLLFKLQWQVKTTLPCGCWSGNRHYCIIHDQVWP